MTSSKERPEILLIEPHSFLRALLPEALPECDVDTAESVEEGREKIDKRVAEQTAAPYDLIVLEPAEPGSQPGIKLVDELKESEATRDIPVLIYTTDDDDFHKKYLKDKGVVDYLVKPSDDDSLPRRIREIVKGIE